MNELEKLVQDLVRQGESDAVINAVIQQYKSGQAGKTNAAAGETATVVADQPNELDSQLGVGLSEPQETPEVPTWLEETFGQDTFGVDFASDMYRAVKNGWRQSSAAGEIADVFTGDKSDQALNNMRAKMKYIQETPQSEEMQSYQKAVEKYKQEGDSGFMAGLKAFVENPSIGPEVMVSSAVQLAGTALEGGAVSGLVAAGAGTGAGVGALAGGIGAIPGAVAGAQGASMMAMEALGTFSELLKEKVEEQGGKFSDNNDIRKVLESDDAMSELYRKAIGRGVAIGTIEAITGGIAGKIGAGAKGLIGLQKVPKLAGALAVEAAGGMAGETAGMLAAGQELAGEEIFLEGIAGAPTAIAQSSLQAAGLGDPEYRVNGKKVKAREGKTAIKDMVKNASDEDFAGMRVKIKNDPKLAEEVQERRKKVIQNNKEAVKQKIQPEKATDLKEDIKFELKKAEAELKQIRETDGETAAEAQQVIVDALKQRLEEVDNHISFQLDELNEDELLDLMNMDDDISLFQSILNDPSSSEAAKKSARAQLSILKESQINKINDTDSADLARPDGPRKQKNVDLSQKTQDAYERGGKNAWAEIAEHQMGTVKSIATSLWSRIPDDKKVGTYDDFVAGIISEPGGLKDMVASYKPELGVPLAAYLGDRRKGLRVRANRIVKNFTKQDIQSGLDSKEAMSAFAEGIDIDAIDLGPEFLYQKLGLGRILGDLTNDVEIALTKTESELSKLGKVTQKKRQATAEKAFNSVFINKYDKKIKEFIGKNTKNDDSFSKFIKNNFTTLRKIALSNIDFQKGSGISKTWNQYAPNLEDFLDYYEGKDITPDQPSSTKNDRKNKLVKAIEAQLAKDARESYFRERPTERAEFNEQQQISFQRALVEREPNTPGEFTPESTAYKAIFMVGSPGGGKTNVGKGLQLGRRGYKVVNQDIALEALKKAAGLPENESNYNEEQRSLRSKLGAQAVKAGKDKFQQYKKEGKGFLVDGTGASYNATTKKIKELEDAGYEVYLVAAMTPKDVAIERNKAREERSLPTFVVSKSYDQVVESLAKYKEDYGDRVFEIDTTTIGFGEALPQDFLNEVYNGITQTKVKQIPATNPVIAFQEAVDQQVDIIMGIKRYGAYKQLVPEANIELEDQSSYNKYISSFLNFVDHDNTKELNINNIGDLLKAQEDMQLSADSGYISPEGLEAGNLANFGKKVVIKDPNTGEFVSKSVAKNRKIPKQNQERYYELKGPIEGSEGNYIKVPGKYEKNAKGDYSFVEDRAAINLIEDKAADLLKPDTSKGSLYWSAKKDPAYLRLKESAKNNYSGSRVDGKIKRLDLFSKTNNIIVNKVLSFPLFKKGVNDFNSQAKINQKIIAQLTKDFALAVRSGVNPFVAGMILKGAYQSTSGGIKASYEFKWMETGELEFGLSNKYTESYKGNSKRRVREEHSPPASVFAAKLIQVALTADPAKIESIIGDMYDDAGQFLISFKHDEMLDQSGLASSIVEGSFIGKDSSLTRIVSAGIPVRKIINKNGLTIADIAKLGNEIPNLTANEAALEEIGPRTEKAIQSAIQFQEANSPNPELTNNEKIDALTDLFNSIYGTKATRNKQEAIDYLVDIGFSEQKAKEAVEQKGFRVPGLIYVSEKIATLDTLIHEFTHEWADLVYKRDPELFEAIYDKLKSHPRFQEAVRMMARSDFYSKFSPDSFEYKNEVMAHILGLEGKSLYEIFEGDAEAKSLIDKFFDYVKEALGFDPATKNFADLTLDEVIKLAVKDIAEGNPATNFNKLKNVAEGKSWFAKSEAAAIPSAKAKADPIVRALNKLKLSYRENKNLARAINDAYSEVEGMMSFIDFAKLIAQSTKQITTGKTKQLLVAKAEVIKANKIAEENAKKQAEAKVSEDKAAELQKKFRRLIYIATAQGAKPSKWFIPPNAEDIKGLLYAFLPKGQRGVEARKWMEETILKPYSDAIAALDTEILHKSKAWADMSKGFDFNKKVDGTPYTLGDAIKVYNAMQDGKDPGIAKKAHVDALIHAVESNSEILDIANEVAESFPIELKDGWQNRSFASEIYNSINDGARKRHLVTFSENVDAIFTDATLDLIADQMGPKFRQALVSTLRRMKSGRNRTSMDANANSYMNWLNRAVGTTMFLNTRSAVLQLLSTLNFIGKPDNNIFAATAAFADRKQWKEDYNKLWNSDYLVNRRDGAKFDVLADEIAQDPDNWISKLLQKGFLPTRYADSYAIAFGGAGFYRNRANSYMAQGMSKEDAEAQAMVDWREAAEESQQSSDPSKISEIQASSIGKVIYAFANTPFQYARIVKRKLQDITSGRSAAEGNVRRDMGSILYYAGAQALIFNALQSGLVALLMSDDDDDEKLKNEKYALMIERSLTSFAKSTGNPGAVASTLYAVLKEAYEQQTGKRRPDGNALAITATSISPPINSKLRDIAGAYRAFNKIEEGDLLTPSLDNEALTMAGEVAAFAGVPLDRAIRKARHLAAISNEEVELWQKIWMLAGWSEWELGVDKSSEIKFDAKLNFSDADFGDVDFEDTAFNRLERGVAGKAHRDGTIEVDPNLSPVEREKTIAHEKQHIKDIKAGKLDYDDNFVYWNGGKHKRENGMIEYKGKMVEEGHPSLPWEKKAYDAEPSTKEIKEKKKRTKLY